MKKYCILVFIAAVVLGLTSCSSETGNNSQPINANSIANNNQPNSANNVNTVNAANAPIPNNSSDVVPAEQPESGTNIDAAEEPANANVPLNPMMQRRNEKIEAMRRADKGDPNAPLKTSVHPAPENSEFTATLTDVGIETRTFKNHPQLLKVVKTTAGDTKSIKVYLKNGRVIDVPGAKIPTLFSAPTAQILDAAGVKP